MKRMAYLLVLAGLAFVLIAACGGGSKGAATTAQSQAKAGDSASAASSSPSAPTSTPSEAPTTEGRSASPESSGLIRRVLYSLEPEEEIMQGESVIGIVADEPDVAPDAPDAARADFGRIVLVISSGQGEAMKYSVVRDGKKLGPFAELEEAMKVAYEGRKEPGSRPSPCAVYKPGKAPEDSSPEQAEDNGGQSFRFKGKAFGPYALLYAITVTPDGGRAFFTASNNDKAYFGCTDGRSVSFGGIPTDFKFSPDGKNAVVLVQGTLSLDGMKNLDKLPPEKMTEVLKESDKRFLFTIDGRKFGPFAESFEPYSFWFASGSNDLYYRVDDGLYRNGNLLLKSESLDSCGFYPSADGKAYVLFTYDAIRFSDGRSYPSPVDLAVFARAGRTIFKWLAFENKKDFVVYERAM